MPSYLWLHTDARGMSVAIEEAIARAATWENTAGDPDATRASLQRADLRALLVATFYMIDAFSLSPAKVLAAGELASVEIGERTKSDFASADRLAIAHTLLETVRTLVVAVTRSNTPPAQTPEQFGTVGGGSATPLAIGKEAGFGWPVAAVAIVGVTIQAGVICYCADKIAIVIDNELTRREATRQMVATHSVVLQVLSGHRAAEETAGKELPLTDAEKAAIKAVQTAQITAQKAIKIEVPSLFPNLRPEGKKIVGALENIGLAGIAAVAVVAYLLLSKGR